MNHVGAQILQLLARLFPEEFTALEDYCRRHAGFFDDTVRRFERELQFYLAFLDYIKPLRSAGLSFCYPEVNATSKDIFATDTFDLALAKKLVSENKPVVTNEFISAVPLSGTADKYGFIVVYPSGTGRTPAALSWNGGNCCGFAMEKKIDDVAFIRAVLDDLEKVVKVDPRRVHAAGMSNGAS